MLVGAPDGMTLKFSICSCPQCKKPIIVIDTISSEKDVDVQLGSILWPQTSNRPIPKEVEEVDPNVANDFREAALVLPLSAKASAALSRRCLQAVLHSKGKTKSKDLARQIEEVIDKLPPEIADTVDAVRNFGNFAAHPIKSQSTGEILDVEPGEAEWLLDLLETLFEHYYVAPVRAAARMAALNKKLTDAGKPTLKTPSPKP